METMKLIGGFSASGAVASVTAFEISPAAAAWLLLFICIISFVRGAKA